MKMKKIIFVVLVFMIASLCLQGCAQASSLDDVITGMENIGKVSGGESSRVMYVINAVIKLIQIAGSGIAIITVTMLGLKYMIASSGEKADIKKTAIPVVIGCVLLFAASNIVAIIADAGIGMN